MDKSLPQVPSSYLHDLWQTEAGHPPIPTLSGPRLCVWVWRGGSRLKPWERFGSKGISRSPFKLGVVEEHPGPDALPDISD